MSARIALVVGALAAWTLLAGCNNSATIDTGGGAPREVASSSELVAQARPPIPDLPVPIGFSLDAKNSRSFAGAGTRWVVHRYAGGESKWAVGRFYKRQMEVHGWQLDSDRMIQGTIYLDFSKAGQRCVVKVTDGSWFTRTVIWIEVYSLGQVDQPVDR